MMTILHFHFFPFTFFITVIISSNEMDSMLTRYNFDYIFQFIWSAQRRESIMSWLLKDVIRCQIVTNGIIKNSSQKNKKFLLFAKNWPKVDCFDDLHWLWPILKEIPFLRKLKNRSYLRMKIDFLHFRSDGYFF